MKMPRTNCLSLTDFPGTVPENLEALVGTGIFLSFSKNTFFSAWTAEISQALRNLRERTNFGMCNGYKIGNKMLVCHFVVQCLCYSKDKLLTFWHTEMSVIIGSSCVLWDHWCVSELNEYQIVRSPSTCDSSDLNGFHFVCQCIRQPSFCRVTRDMCHSVDLSAFLFRPSCVFFINETS